MATNLPPGSSFKGKKMLPTIIPSHTIPDIKKDTIIIGVCGVDLENLCPVEGDGWFVSDFLALNYLLKGTGSSQTWMTTVSEEQLASYIENEPSVQPGFLHGNPYNDRKVVFNRAILNRQEMTPFRVHSPSEITQAFLSELQHACSCSASSSPPSPILVFVFGHGVDNAAICLDYGLVNLRGDLLGSLTINDVRNIVNKDPRLPVTLVTTACFSGGWSVHPDLNMTILTAAGPPSSSTEAGLTMYSHAWPNSKSISRASGSMFASAIINAVSEETSPLLEHARAPADATTGNTSVADTTISSSSSSSSLQPEHPTQHQTETYNKMCHTIRHTMLAKITRRPDYHDFRFSAQDDDWGACWMGRTGIPLSHFKARWDALPIYPPTSDPSDPTNLDPVANPPDPDSPPPRHKIGRTGGTLAAAPLPPKSAMRRTAGVLATLCPGDWTAAPEFRLRGRLLRFARGAPPLHPGHEQLIYDTVGFRLSVARFMDRMTQMLQLPMPLKQCCLTWDWQRWDDVSRPNATEESKYRYQGIVFYVEKAGLFSLGSEAQSGNFQRAPRYLCAALFDWGRSSKSTVEAIEVVVQRFEEEKTQILDDVVSDADVSMSGQRWLQSVGRG